MLNGSGLRVVLWVAGCQHHCPYCQNPITHDPNGGIPFDEAAKQEIFAELEKPYVSGITFSGGDPLYPGHRSEQSLPCTAFPLSRNPVWEQPDKAVSRIRK